MAIDFTAGTSPLFLKLGKIIHAAKTLNTARKTTVPVEVLDINTQFNSASLALAEVVDGLNDDLNSWRSSGNSFLSSLADIFANTIIQVVKADNQQETDSIDDALDELIKQMGTAAATIENNVVTMFSITGIGSPVGNGSLLPGPGTTTVKYANGRNAEFVYGEIVSFEVVDDTTPGSEVFRVRGKAAVDKMSDLWPDGSGADVSLRVVSVESGENVVQNGSLEEADDQEASWPENWIRGSATPAANLKATTVQRSIVFVSGSLAITHTYRVTVTIGGFAFVTEPIAVGASGSTLESELRKMHPVMADVSVVSSGSAPIVRHIVTMTGVDPTIILGIESTANPGADEQQTVSVTGTPTGGTFTLGVTKNDGTTTTVSVPFNRTALDLQNSLKAIYDVLPTFNNVVVCSGGPLPGTPIQVFWSTNRNAELMTIAANNLTGGSSPTPSVAVVTEGVGVNTMHLEANPVASYVGGVSFEHTGNGSTAFNLAYQRLESLKPKTQYAFALAYKLSAASPSSGVLRMSLNKSEGGGDFLDDDLGVDNKIDLALTSVGDANWHLVFGVFRTPSVLPSVIYLLLSTSTPYQNTRKLWIDNIILCEMTPMYPGGISLAAMGGSIRWRLGDKYLGLASNARTGELHEWFNRFLDLDQKGKMIPSAVSPTLTDGAFIN